MTNITCGFNTTLDGFTLIETFVAITILLTAIVGPLTIASKGLSSSFLAKEQTTASFLAQEAVEYIRWKRDSNALSGRAWLSGLAACTNATCYIDAVSDTAGSCGSTCPALHRNASTGLYTYTASDPTTEYTRSIQMSTINSNESRVMVTVVWYSLGITHTFVAVENMFNWQ